MKKTIIYFLILITGVSGAIVFKNNYLKIAYIIIAIVSFVNSIISYLIYFYKKYIQKEIMFFIFYSNPYKQNTQYSFFSKPIAPKNMEIRDFNEWIVLQIKDNHRLNYNEEIEPVINDIKLISTEYSIKDNPF
jgi:hypothetical protein